MPEVAALLMAAGNARRMGGPNKLLLPFCTKPLVQYAVNAVAGAHFSKRLLISGRDHATVEMYAPDFEIIYNPNFVNGFGMSLAIGFSALSQHSHIEGALIMLADMPLITAASLNQMIEAFDGQSIIRASHKGQTGNPVIMPKSLFSKMANLNGDESGQGIIKACGLPVKLIDIGPACLADADTPETFAALQEATYGASH